MSLFIDKWLQMMASGVLLVCSHVYLIFCRIKARQVLSCLHQLEYTRRRCQLNAQRASAGTSNLFIEAVLQYLCCLQPPRPKANRKVFFIIEENGQTTPQLWNGYCEKSLNISLGFQYSRWEKIWGCNPWMDHGIALSHEQPVWALPVNPCTHP